MPLAPPESPFRRAVLAWLVGVAVCSLALAVAFVIVRPERSDVRSFEADSFSRSAVGHRALVELLRATGVPVLVSRYASAERAGQSSLLVLAEPRLEWTLAPRAIRVETMLAAARTTLLVLPKWEVREDPRARGWIISARLQAAGDIDRALRLANVPATLSRPGPALPATCEGSAAAADWDQPQFLVATSPALQPLLRCAAEVLLGEVRTSSGGRLLVLSDPDPISNQGLGRGGNARLILDILALARSPNQAVVIDETLHGHERVPSVWRELFTPALLPALAQAVLVLSALVWSGVGRFGAPIPVPAELASGKRVLIDNTASLLSSAGHSGSTLGRYLDATIVDVARALGAPPTARPAELREWLLRAGRRRGVGSDLAAIEAQVDRARRPDSPSASAIVAVARRIHLWKKEMLRGPQDDPGR